MDNKKIKSEGKIDATIKQKLESDLFVLSVCKDSTCQPYLNCFNFDGDNYDQKKLGKLFGVIKVQDRSENSAYVANIITQVIKKEFYRHCRGNSLDNFEEALHKANLALADLSRCEVIEWMGKLDAIVGVINKNNLIFSCAGNGIALLARDGKVSAIQSHENEKNELNVHPIKTFSELSNGKLQNGDKLIISTLEFLEIFQEEDVQRHLGSLSSNEFDNLISSTLKSEATNIGLIIINETTKSKILSKEQVDDTKKTSENDKNFFGTTITKKDKRKGEKKRERKPKLKKTIREKRTNKKSSKLFNNSNIIYMKEDEEFPQEEAVRENILKKILTKLTNYFENFKFKQQQPSQTSEKSKPSLKETCRKIKLKLKDNENWKKLADSTKLAGYKNINKIIPSKIFIRKIPEKIKGMINVKNRNKKG